VGTKTIKFNPPSAKLRTLSIFGEFFNFSEDHQVDGEEPIEITLSPGDAVYIPPLWWHYVTGENKSISIAVTWDNTTRDRIFGFKLPIRNIVNRMARRYKRFRYSVVSELRESRSEVLQFFQQVSL